MAFLGRRNTAAAIGLISAVIAIAALALFENIGAVAARGTAAPASHHTTRGVQVAAVVDQQCSMRCWLRLPQHPAPPKPAPVPTPPLAPALVASVPAPRHTSPPPPPPVPAAPSAASAVFQAINSARAKAGLPALRWSDGLARSAHQHNLAMAAANQLSHQLPGEAPLGNRVSSQGVSWTWCAENIGYSSNLSTSGALGLENAMVNETPPNDDHRQNILSSTATMVGVDVVFDSTNHLLWLTEDFAN